MNRRRQGFQQKIHSALQWKRMEIELEIRTLQRELEHLSTKMRNRVLSVWEQKRFEELNNDLSQLEQCFNAVYEHDDDSGLEKEIA